MAIYDDAKDVTVNSVIEALRTAPVRIEEVKGTGSWTGMDYTSPEIFYDGAWRSLCRTDLCDDVCTGFGAIKTAEEWREYYLAKAAHAHSVRIGSGRFAIIDSMTDG
jgi:hypothetical protein